MSTQRISAFIIGVCIALLVFTSSVWAKSLPRPFAEQVFECVYRVVGADGDIATGFFVTCADSAGSSHSVLVTARHVFEQIDGDTVNVYLRKQNDKGSYEVWSYPVHFRANGHDLFTRHPDSTVDLAAIEVPLPAGFTVRVASKALLADAVTFDDYSIVPGTELFFLGYPKGYSSGEGDFPILRSGTVASYPIDLEGMYLIDGAVYEGNSGGLVYVDPPLGFNPKNRLEKQAPIVIGVVTTSIAEHRADSTAVREFLNIGGVISSVRVRELLDAMGCR